MKHIIKGMLAACLFYPVLLQAQNEVDALRYSQNYFGSTARSFSMGGAFGALGADYSAMASNPAGLGVYRRSEFSFSMGFMNRNTESDFLFRQDDENRFSFDLPNLGMVFAFPKKKEKGLTQFAFALGYHRTANFNTTSFFAGKNRDNSMLDAFIEDIRFYGGATPDDLYYDFPFDANLAYQTYLLNPDTVEANQYISVIPDGNEYQSLHTKTYGGMGEFALGFGGSVNDKIYFGATFGFPNIRYEEESTYEEKDPDNEISVADSLNFKSFRYDRFLLTTGNGINAKFGVIIKPVEWIRVGAAIHTPTYFYMNDRYRTVMYSSFEGHGYDYASPEGTYSYNLVTPYKAVGSLAFIFGKRGVLSFDYELTSYSMANLDASDYNFSYENKIIEKAYRDVSSNFHGGIEIKQNNFAFRAGAAYYSASINSDYSTTKTDQHSMSYTAGVGYRGKRFFADIGYGYTVRGESYSPYFLTNEEVPAATYEKTDNRIVTTFGIRF